MKLTSHMLLASVALSTAAFFVSACPGKIDNPEAFLTGVGGAGACSLDVEADIFQAKCNNASCHNADDRAAQLDLESAGIASRVVGVTADCGGLLADPDNPEDSVLYTKLDSDPGCGTQMPLGGSELSDAEKSCILSWIAEQSGGSPTTTTTSSGGGMGGMGMGGMGMGGAGGSGGAGGN